MRSLFRTHKFGTPREYFGVQNVVAVVHEYGRSVGLVIKTDGGGYKIVVASISGAQFHSWAPEVSKGIEEAIELMSFFA